MENFNSGGPPPAPPQPRRGQLQRYCDEQRRDCDDDLDQRVETALPGPFGRYGGAASQRAERSVATEGEGIEDRLPHRRDAGAGAPAGGLDDLIATGDEPAHRLYREHVPAARLQALPSGATDPVGSDAAIAVWHHLLVAH